MTTDFITASPKPRSFRAGMKAKLGYSLPRTLSSEADVNLRIGKPRTFSPRKFIDRSKLPKKSGVYQFYNKSGDVIYVGKAINLYHRVLSYFSGRGDVKTSALVERIVSVKTIVVESELEALLLEANLIKRYLPKFNVRLTDDKDYLYIGITKEDFPKVVTIRKKDLKLVKKFFGPFPSARTVRDTLKLLRKVFPWCSNPPKKSFLDSYYTAEGSGTIAETRLRACFYYHINLCPGACVGLVTKEQYNKIISRFSKFLEVKKEELIKELLQEMDHAARDERFEEAAKTKKMIYGIYYLTQTNRTSLYLENPNFLEDENKTALKQLQQDLNLPKSPQRIEAYDISNIQGQDATGSLVVLTNGEIDKSQYRKFRINLAGKPNDVGMHKEMLERRLNHPEWPRTDLILVDGGRGQARVYQEVLRLRDLSIPVFGLAKRMEWIYPPEGEVVKLPKRSLSLKLLQKIRDEAHRFAISYYRKLHQRSVILR